MFLFCGNFFEKLNFCSDGSGKSKLYFRVLTHRISQNMSLRQVLMLFQNLGAHLAWLHKHNEKSSNKGKMKKNFAQLVSNSLFGGMDGTSRSWNLIFLKSKGLVKQMANHSGYIDAQINIYKINFFSAIITTLY